jgi:membrane-bound serine protease (ClpP class)
MRNPIFSSRTRSSRTRKAIALSIPALLFVAGVAGTVLAATQPASPAPARPATAEAREVLHVRVHSIVHPVLADFLADAVEEADKARAAALIIELDTPGGLLTSTREITQSLLAARTPVVVYVSPSGSQAASAGFFILMAADVAVMAPSTNAGAAHPVGGQGETIEGVLGKKAEEDAAAYIRSLASRYGRNQELAQAAVVESRSFSAEEALQARLIDLIAPGLPQLLLALDGRPVQRGDQTVVMRTANSPIREYEMSGWRDLLGVIAHPNIAYILLTLGGLGLYFELMHPGAVLPGVVGAIFLVLAFFSLSVLPFSYTGLALIFLALLFFIAEIKVTSYGMLTVAGTICLVLGGLMLFKSSEPAMRVSLNLIGALAVLSLGTVGGLLALALRARRRPVTTGKEGMIHQHGVARSDLAPQGKVFIHGEIWDAVAQEPVTRGETVEVVGIRDLLLAVRPVRGGRLSSGNA